VEKEFYIYILASKPNSTLYIGMTSDLVKRVWQHKEGLVDGFTKKHAVNNLVYYEKYNDSENAINRERQMKKWKRGRKIELIEKSNPKWLDLYRDISK